jgi:predicted nucleic acid-binding protein
LPGSRREEVYFLDTSAIVKRYVLEPGSSLVDEVYSNAYRGLVKLALSYWNIAEAARASLILTVAIKFLTPFVRVILEYEDEVWLH